jgi:transposase InsO family protein
MQLWQIDVMSGVLLDDDTELKLVTGVDDHSRFCVAAGLVTRATARAVCEVFSRAMKTYGIPDEVLTDNGKAFTGRFGTHKAEVLFDRICRENGISHRLTAPRSPTTTGKIEPHTGQDPMKCGKKASLETARNLLCRGASLITRENRDRRHRKDGARFRRRALNAARGRLRVTRS